MVTLIYLRAAVLLSTQPSSSWREIQGRFFDYKASLGPWSVDELFDFLDDEYPDHTISRSDVEAFIVSGEELMSVAL